MARGNDPTARGQHRQSAVIPYRATAAGVEVLLITSRGRGDWIVPKGYVEDGMSEADSAAKEAWEEAGVRGKVASASAVGSFAVEKLGVVWHVAVYDFEVCTVADAWPEHGERERRWASVAEAASLVRRAELRDLIQQLPVRVASRTPRPDSFFRRLLGGP